MAVEHWPLTTATIIDIVVSVIKERHYNSRRFLCGQKMQTKTMNGSDMMWQTAAAQLAVFFLQERRSLAKSDEGSTESRFRHLDGCHGRSIGHG